MFKLDVSDTYSCVVSFEIPVNDGRTEKITFDATFKRLSRPEVVAIPQRIRDDALGDDGLVREIMVGWKGVVDGAGQEVPFSSSALEQAINKFIPFAPAVIAAWTNSLKGGKEKN